MDELERAFRDALKRADTVAVPVAVDPAQLTGSPRRPGWPGGLAVAAVVVLVGGIGVWSWLGRAGGPGVPAVPAAPPVTTVTVDLYSGRENPSVRLDPAVADELYDGLADLAPTGLELTDLPDVGLGFRGFVVTPPDETRPVLRVLPGTVVVDPDGSPEILADPGGRGFATIADSLPTEVADQVAPMLVQIRIGNGGDVDLSGIQVTFPDNQVVEFGTLAPGGTSDYHPVGLAYRYALILATAGDEQHRWQPIDFVGETPLAPGRYTYRISVDGDQIDLEFIEDPPLTAPSPPNPTQASDGPSREPTAVDSPGGPETPAATAGTVRGEAATWVLVDPEAVTADSTSLRIAVTRLGCSDGVTGTVLDPVIDYGPNRISVQALVEPLPVGGSFTCPGNDAVEVEVQLAEPVGQRELVDVACLEGEAVGTSFCAAGAVRRPA